MRINLGRCFATLMGLTVVTPAFADYGQSVTGDYVPPSKWNTFNAPGNSVLAPAPSIAARPTAYSPALTPTKTLAPQPHHSTSTPTDIRDPRILAQNLRNLRSVRPVSGHDGENAPSQPLPAPAYAVPQPESLDTPQGMPSNHFQDGYSVADPSVVQPSPLSQALSAPWSDCDPAPQTFACGPTRQPLSPWFAGGNVLFWNMADSGYQRFTLQDGAPGTTHLSTNDISPNSSVGYDVFFGRYLDCGRYGISANYLNFNPGSQEATAVTPAIGDYYAAMPHWNQISIDRDGAGGNPAQTVYDIYDDDAAAHRIRRDVSIQGIEINLSCFGIMGARRIAPASCGSACGTGDCCGPNSGCGSGIGRSPFAALKRCIGGRYGYTTAGGPLERPCTGGVQVVTTHGFRWFQFRDEFQFASTDAYDGYVGPTDMFYDSNVTNNLYGYQFGSKLVYCLSPCLTANLGGKAGLYGNDVQVDQRIGTPTIDAYVTSDNTQRINTHVRDTVLAGLGEIDLGLGYRCNQAWTINGGYRMLYAGGVATSIGSIPNEYFTVGPSQQTYANDSLLLHGAYVGAAFNW